MMFGEIIKAYREREGTSQERLAEQLGISRNYLSMLERDKAWNVSFALGKRILSLGKPHEQIEIVLVKRVMVDAAIAPEVAWLNSQGVWIEGTCQGIPPSYPPTALIVPSSKETAEELGYTPVYRESLRLYEIELKSK